jgi:aminocarboxymuconate-semialdehyde decarboxylase
MVDLSATGDAEHDVLHYLRNRCLLDSCSYHPPALDCAVATVSAERIMLGSDFPFRGPIKRATDDIGGSALGEADRAAILRGNAVRAGLYG